MKMETRPRSRGAQTGFVNIKALGRALDRHELSSSPPKVQPETTAVRTLVQRFGLTIHHARVVCELAGIGGAA